MDKKEVPLIRIDPNDPEGSIQRYLDVMNAKIAYCEQDDGKLIGLRYTGTDPRMWSFVVNRQAYAMIATTEDEPPHLDIIDYYVSEKEAVADPDVLARFKKAGFDIVGHVHNRYADLLGLVWPDSVVMNTTATTLSGQSTASARRIYDGASYVPAQDVAARRDAWIADPVPSLADSKKPYLDQLFVMKETLEELVQQDWTQLKEQAKLDAHTRGQKRELN